MLALGAALTIVGTLIGRRVTGPTRSGTHLYVVALAGTGAGKQHAIDCIKSALIAARAKSNIGPGDFTSSRAVVKLVKRQPLSLCAMDERPPAANWSRKLGSSGVQVPKKFIPPSRNAQTMSQTSKSRS